jgi:flagellar biosynthesis/type III secretory pathway protein FliH
MENNALIFRKIRDGKMTLEEFIKWVETEAYITHKNAYDEGFQAGYEDGHHDASMESTQY